MKKVDTRGQLCPKPIIMAKALFNELDLGEQMEVLTDSETSLNNLINFFTALNAMPVSEKQSRRLAVYMCQNH
jgi:TusA-related sulfurtransferase